MPQRPDANAYAERWVGSLPRECLDRLLIFGRRQLEHVLRVYIRHFNQQRPHQALNMRYPAEIYRSSPRLYNGLPQLEYPFHDRTITVTRCGRICLGAQKINLSQAFAGQKVGVKQVADRVWLVSFMQYDLGFFDDESIRVECAPNPFNAKVLPTSPAV